MNQKAYYGEFGGQYVAESLMNTLEELDKAFEEAIHDSEFVERFPEFSLFYRLFSPLDSEMICIFPYFYPCEESAREIREIFI